MPRISVGRQGVNFYHTKTFDSNNEYIRKKTLEADDCTKPCYFVNVDVFFQMSFKQKPRTFASVLKTKGQAKINSWNICSQ